MSVEIKVPQLPESVADATLVSWHRKAGEAVRRDENLVDLETDKVVLEVPAPTNGILKEIKVQDGATVTAGEVLAIVEPGEGAAEEASARAEGEGDTEGPAAAPPREAAGGESAAAPQPSATEPPAGNRSAAGAETAAPAEDRETAAAAPPEDRETAAEGPYKMGPAVRKLVEEHDLDPAAIPRAGREGRITKADVLDYLASHRETTVGLEEGAPRSAPGGVPRRGEQRVAMTRMRARIAERLVDAQQTAAMLTTFNEVDMTDIIAMRKRYQERFQARYDIKLGFMSFFVRASIEALREFPAVNASIDGKEVVYHEYFDVGVAVSTDRGLVVPVLRDADAMSFAGIEEAIRDFGTRAQSGQLGMEELTGGTFTITNGGIFGSLLSTPILNPPQSAILGMHAIQERPVVVDGAIEARPMMYLALTYDHRLVDGREAVQFLVRIKQQLEDPARLILQI